MVESVDNLLGILHAQKGRELRFEVGQRARLVTDTGAFDLSQTPLTPADIRNWMGPIMPDSAKQALTQNPGVDFDYNCHGVGPFKVTVMRANGTMSFVFKPAQSGQAVAAAPAPQRPAEVQPPARQPAATPATPPPVVQSASRASSSSAAMDNLFRAMFDIGASDLHLSVSMPPMVRKDGEMKPLHSSHAVLTDEDTKRLLTSIMPPKNLEEFERRRDTDFAYEIQGLARFRANVFADRKGMGGVFRVIPNKIMTAEDLKISQHVLRLCHLNKGLVLVTGPTGSGKSTTLCALIDYINRNRTDHIITIEDPIEFVHENKKCLINQREVHNHTDSFRDALRAALREDPDIVLVGEMRDLETVAIAIETAETGHLVFGTLHTTTAASTVDRVIDQFPPDRQMQIRIMLSESLRGVISQTLLRKIGGGRLAALETLIVNPAVSNLIREAKTFQIPSVMQTQKAIGNLTLNEALIEPVNKKLVTADEAYSKAVDKPGFETLLKRNNHDTKFVIQSTT
ncbi:MAG: type IV pili twitching motility protein PilT [Blastocatellia bacterium AA13]|nr:MAG: type IV pili twitching motility protein PilT [Blastocatellia bacterium AA13]